MYRVVFLPYILQVLFFFFFPRDVPKVLLVIIQRISVIRTA